MKANPFTAVSCVVMSAVVITRSTANLQASPPIGPAGIALVQGSYGLFELGSLGGTDSIAADINNNGAITGSAGDGAGGDYGFLWRDGIMTRLDALQGGTFSAGAAISALGAVGGTAEQVISVPGGKPRTERHAVRWQNGPPQVMGNPGGSQGPEVHGITAGGTLVGSVATSVTNQDGSITQVQRPVRWPGGIGDFLTSDPRANGEALAVSPDGRFVVGHYRPPGAGTPQAAVFNADPPLNIHTLSSQPGSVALAANSSGIVAGYTFASPLPTFYEPFFWKLGRGMWRPPLPPGSPNGQVMDITDNGLAVGAVRNLGVVLWLNVGGNDEIMIPVQGLLPPNAPVINGPVSINEYGEMAAVRVAGTTHAVFLYPTNRWRQVSGVIRTTATEAAADPAGAFPQFIHPLRDAPVELLALRGATFVPVARNVTGDAGNFAFLFRADSPDTRFALRFTLSDASGTVDVFDASTDTNAPAWIRTPAFAVERDTRADIDLIINGNPRNPDPNKTDYQLNGASFSIGPTNAPPTEGASNSNAADFAHLTIFYRNIRLAAQFARNRLGLPMPRMPVHAFEPRGSFSSWTLSPTTRPNIQVWVSTYDDAASFTQADPLSLHFAQIASSYNQPTLGLPGNPNGYSRLRIFTNSTTHATTNVPVAWGRERPDNREFHEYSHAIMFHSSIGGVDAFPPYLVNPVTHAHDKNHAGYANSVSTDSWIEGFAEFMSAVISSVMLDETEKPVPSRYWVQGTIINLEDSYSYTNHVRAWPPSEETLVASILWDLHDPLGVSPDDETLKMPVEDWWGILSTQGPGLLSMKNVADAFGDFAAQAPFRLNPADWAARLVNAGLFDDLTFNDARSGNGVFDPGEKVGMTSWNSHFPHRYNASVDRWIALDITTADGSSVSNVTYQFDIRYDPPLDDRSHSWAFPTYGPASVALPFMPPPHPCQIRITALAPGLPAMPPLILSGDDAWKTIEAMPTNGDGQILSHVFMVPPTPRLTVTRISGGSQLEFSWPYTEPPFELQFTASLKPPVLWGRPPGAAVRNGDRFSQIVGNPPGNVFLRLIRK